MEKFRLTVIGASCVILLITVALIHLTQLNIVILLDVQASTAMIMVSFLVIQFMSDQQKNTNQ